MINLCEDSGSDDRRQKEKMPKGPNPADSAAWLQGQQPCDCRRSFSVESYRI